MGDAQVKVAAGDDFAQIQAAADALKAVIAAIPGARDVQDDNLPGRGVLRLTLKSEALRELGLSPAQATRLVRLAVDGEVVAFTRDAGDKIELRVRQRLADLYIEAEVLRLIRLRTVTAATPRRLRRCRACSRAARRAAASRAAREWRRLPL